MKKGLTLIELLITIVMFVILIGVTAYVFRAVLLSWSSAETRAGIDISLDRAIEEMVRDLREAADIRTGPNPGDEFNEIRYTKDGTDYIYYLYNSNDTYVPPPAFDQDVYELRRATLSGGIGGTFTYGNGLRVMTDVLPPTTSELSDNGALVTIDLTIKRDDEQIRSKTEVKTRNR